jgi:DNA polymerase III epsilon subunit family exonuclease
MTVTTLTTELGGRTLTIENGKLALLAGGSVTVRYGDTVVLGTANRSEPRPGLDFFPLTIDFEERMYAAGKIPGGFIKREARPSEGAILAARLTDRPIRPLFPEGYKDDVQCVVTVLSTDQENDPDVLGTIAASTALTISEIPFLGPVAAVRIGRIDGQFVVNPTTSQMDESELDLVVSGTREAIMMVEAGAKILPESVMADAIMFGHRSLLPIIELQEQLRAQVGKAKRVPFIEPDVSSVVDFVDAVSRGVSFVVFDTETTSRDAATGELVEIGAVRVSGGSVVDRFSTLVKPSRGIVGKQVHRISAADVAGAPSPAEAARQLMTWAGDDILVGHNIGFDIAFLEAALGDGTRIERGRYLDTLALARAAYPDLGVYKLPDLVDFLELAVSPDHRALADAEATAALVLRLAADLPARVNAFTEGVAASIRLRKGGADGAAADAAFEEALLAAGLSKPLTTYLHKKTVRRMVLDEGIRIDGRDADTIRPISVEVGLLPRAHGSGLFTRGQTQALTVATLGPSSDVQRIDTIAPEESKRYLHHYNMPPYSTGENKMMRGPGRREIGHGALAERALIPVLPDQADFPYVIRLVSECVTSNGSTSMASTCGSTLALMDAGVPIKAPVAGAAMGLISDGGRFTILTDILGKEDFFGDMDFKVTGTTEGHHGPADGHQDPGHQRGDHPHGSREGPRGEALHPGQDDRGHPGRPRRRERFRASHHHHQDQPREDPRHHRQGRRHDPQDPGGDRHRDQRRGRRQRRDRGRQLGELVAGHPVDRVAHPRGRGRWPLSRQGDPDHGFRRLRRDPARQGGPRAHRRAGRLPRAHGRGCRPGR